MTTSFNPRLVPAFAALALLTGIAFSCGGGGGGGGSDRKEALRKDYHADSAGYRKKWGIEE